MNYISMLKNILTPPSVLNFPRPNNFQETSLGNIILPDDLIDFLGEYGLGSIDKFLYVFHPLSTNDNLNKSASVYFIESYKNLKYQFPGVYDLNIFPSKNSFFPWAVTDNGDTLNFFICDGVAEDQIILLNSDQSEKEWFNMSCSKFLYELMNNNIKSNILPSDFLSNTHPVFDLA